MVCVVLLDRIVVSKFKAKRVRELRLILLDLQNFINIHFKSPQLGRMMLDHNNTSMLHFVYNSSVVCVLVSHSVEDGNFVLQVPYYPPVETIEDYRKDPQRCLKII